MKKGSISQVNIGLVAGTILLLCPFASPFSQNVDPFYISLLEKAQRSFLEGEYNTAIKQLEISIFGLFSDKKLLAKAHIYMALCFYHLKNSKESEIQLKKALDVVGDEGFAAIEFDEKSRGELSGILARFGLGEYIQPEPEAKIVFRPEELSSQDLPDDNIEETIKDIKDSIAAAPDNTTLYYEVYKLYKYKGSTSESRRILEQLVERHPDEIYAYYLLGLMQFEDRKYKEGEEYFAEALRTRQNLILSQELIEEIKAYQIISTYLRGEKSRALDMMSIAIHLFTETKIRQLPLKGSDKATLREIIREYTKRKSLIPQKKSCDKVFHVNFLLTENHKFLYYLQCPKKDIAGFAEKEPGVHIKNLGSTGFSK